MKRSNFSSQDSALVRADLLRGFDELVMRLGGKPRALRESLNMEPAPPRAEHMPYRQLFELFDVASIELQSTDFGMCLAAWQAAQGAIGVSGPLEVAMRNSPTLGHAYRYCAQRLHAYDGVTQLCLEKFPSDARIFVLLNTTLLGGPRQRQAVEHALALTQHGIHAVSGGEVRACEVWFTHRPLAPLSTYEAHFNATVRFGQSMNALLLDERDFERPLPSANPQLYEMAASFIERRVPKAPIPLRTRARIHIAQLLADGNCTQASLATILQLHRRTLQRKLRREGESFETLRDSVRRDIALRYLQQSDIPLMRLTEILGYSEASVLSRSCVRWFLASPSELRNGLNRPGARLSFDANC